ncbi:copper amine oxidase N-terminal domain-containing protein [Congzhengia minquanensis]|nr:copper amine oxidase N-terminal domain-containing protein [Congzhengia minquanensis]
MKRTVAFFVSLCMALVLIAVPVYGAEDRPIRVMVDGAELAFDVDPVIENDRTLVPMRLIFEALGAKVDWDEATRTALAVKGDVKISITIDSAELMKNSKAVALDAPARLIGGRTLVPVRAVSEGMGAKVDWDEASRMVQIVTSEEPSQPEKPEEQEKPDKTQKPAEQEKPIEQDSKDPGPYIPDGFVDFAELSDVDMAALKARYNNLIRYDFEQLSLPRAVIVEHTSFAKEIKNKSKTAESLARDVWNKIVISHLLEIQTNSETNYYIGDIDGDELYETYLSIVKKAGLAAEEQFDISFETLANGYPMMLVTFRNTDTLMACKFLGAVAMPNGTVRYFTAETDLVNKDNLYFCEVTKTKRGTIGLMGFEKEEFIQCAWITIENDLPMAATLERNL